VAVAVGAPCRDRASPARTGFEVEEISGGYRGEPFTGEGRTMFVVARRI
jgi:hypothetical protein